MSVRGFGGTVEGVRLRNGPLDAALGGAVIGDVPLTRTIDGASVVKLTLSDEQGRLRRHKALSEASLITVDGLRFRLVQISKQGRDLTLTAEDEVAWLMRRLRGPKKAFRDRMTRVEFVISLAREADPKMDIWAPERGKQQPIESAKQARRERDLDLGKGIDRGANLTVKGAKATPAQIQTGNQVLDAAMRFDPPYKALVALVSACIVESVMGTIGMESPVDHDSIGLLQGRQMYNDIATLKSIPKNVEVFLTKGWTSHPDGGAIDQALKFPTRSAGTIAQTCQGSAHPERYDEYADEARRWLEAYGAGGGSGRSVTTVKRFSFQLDRETDYWSGSGDLMEEVNWRRFAVGNRLWIASDPFLLGARPKMRIGENTPGVDDIDWDCDSGKRVHEARVTGRVREWSAPPGTPVILDESHGPAEGRWLVHQIDGLVNRPDVTITLKRPSKPLPEPAPETATRTVGESFGSVGGGADQMVRWAQGTVGTTEGSALHQKWAGRFGYATSLPWCSIWIAYGLIEICGLPKPENPAYSGTWLEWSGGKQVSRSDIRPGDLLIYDWGDGGITDHIALAVGGGKSIGGNESDKVSEGTVNTGALVGVVRPNYG